MNFSKVASGVIIAIIGSIGEISTIVFVYLFLDERLSFLQFFGAFIVLAGIV